MEFETLTGPEKAAILILSLPTETVKSFVGQLADDEVERVMAAVSRFEDVPQGVQEKVLREFTETIGKREDSVVGGRDRARRLVESTLDQSRAQEILEKLGRDERRIDWTLRPFDPPFIAATVAGEHPQTIALILSQIPSERGAAVIGELPEDQRADVVLRLAELEGVSQDVIAQIENGVKDLFGRPPASTARVGGTEVAAQLLNRVGGEQSDSILEGVGSRDPAVAGEIRKRMLTFNDLVQVDRRGMQTLLREVPTEDLAVALKTANEEMREKVFSNVSSRAAEQIRDEIDLLGPMKLADVEKVQEQVVEIARRLQEEGRLNIDLGGGDDVLV